MPIKHHLAQFNTDIVALAYLESGQIAIASADHSVYLYDIATQTQEKIVSFNLREGKTLLYAFDPLHKRFVFGDTGGSVLYLVDMAKKKIVTKYDLGHQSPTKIAFSPDGIHFVCGTTNGRIMLWRCDSSTLIARLHSYPEYTVLYTRPKVNYVSALSFEQNWLATSGYGGSVVITDYRTHNHSHRFSIGNVRTNAIVFYRNSLILGREDGTLLKIDRNGKVPNQRLMTALGALKTVLKIGDTHYLLAASDKSSISLIDAESMKVLHEHYIQTDHPISAICEGEENYLYVATHNGELLRFDVRPCVELETFISSRQYAQAYQYCQSEPLLFGSTLYRDLEEIYETAKKHALEALEKQDFQLAKTLLEPFAAAKAKEITAILKAFSQMERFVYLYEKRKLSPFYGLAEQFPHLQSTQLFQKVEKLWAEQFLKAQKLAFVNKKKEALSEVEAFFTVNAKRPFILLITQHLELLRAYSKAIHHKDFHLLSDLIQHNPILRKLPSYATLTEKAGELPGAITEALKQKEFEYASVLLERLGDIPHYEDVYRELKYFTSSAAKLDHSIVNNQWRSAYQLLDTYPELTILPWANELEVAWQEKLLRCEKHAMKADIASIKNELGNLITLPNRNGRIGDILRMGYMVQLKVLIQRSPASVQPGITQYCELFGMDTEAWQLIQSAEAAGIGIVISQELMVPKKREQWTSWARHLPDRISA